MFESIELSVILISAIAGALIGIPTGPSHFFTVDTFMNEGRIAALKVYGGLLTAKLLYAGIALLTNDLISSHPKIEPIVYLLASLLLMGWGVFIIVKSKSGEKKDSSSKDSSSIDINIKSLFKKGFVLGISNPAIPFVYLAFVQILKMYAENINTVGYIIYIGVFEIISFITLAGIAMLLLIKKGKVLDQWHKVKIGMGVLIFFLGAYNVYQHVEIKDGIHLRNGGNALEKNINGLGIEKE